MLTNFSRRACVVAFTVAFGSFLSAIASLDAHADANDYAFQFVHADAKKGDGALVVVRLIDKRSGKAVPDAVIFASRIDMAPEEMPGMTAPLEAIPSDEPGVYRFKTSFAMEGGWRLSLAAKVQGETGTVESKLVLQVKP